MTYNAAYHADYYQKHKEHKRKLARAWEARNPEKVKAMSAKQIARRKELGLDVEARKRWEAKNREYLLWNAAKQRARKRGIEFTITRDDIKIPEFCPILGIKINTLGRGRMQQDSPSLDKMDPSKGYTPDNIWVISWRANRMKSDASPEELARFCEGMLNAIRSTRWLGKQ